ncbi:type II toxin-antitoxin system PemK/MazF family toxin [Listeria welshimeri]|uniref:type II toxin-antitoxin system PemK/MazF family toxin n=1 Tax=Listeria welshimeri TaxID=1643 RepID=UPI00162A511B|nr:type II toxin-antitoxin system PemK/MazF family toxin [Listeria welshimeri]MBC1342347.1 type II toxin-antitoxin system PemK/MazF family toxin [Listeria welshimeri]MBC1350700.1 type II toxin-antitoxin system PemK/MazF family toxin [Listeria welshimeri]MBC1705851.1 type II toxin-antitoxin system PemK/MazF family toxin [Listeria welshimeri]MBF2342532.1 type II toxin-antitoxin system PemK/MazF family toxin [Listeria welshimeri]
MYIPKQRDIIWVNFDPAKGHEIQKKRPALVITNDDFNRVTRFCGICPITSSNKKFPTNVELTNTKTQGVILTSQFRTIDFSNEGRAVEYIEKLPTKEFLIVAQLINLAFDFPIN